MADDKHIIMDDRSWEKNFVEFDKLPDLPKDLQNEVDSMLTAPSSEKTAA